MRILHLIDSYPPILGGAQRHVRDLAAALATRGHSVAVATLANDAASPFAVEQGVRVYRRRGTVHRLSRGAFADPGRRYAPPWPDPELVWALRGVIARERPQVIHAHNWMVYSVLPLKAWSRAKLVFTLHEYSLACPKWTLMYHDALCSGPALAKCLECAAGHYGPLKGALTVVGKRAMDVADRNWIDLYLPVSQAVAAGNGLVGSRQRYEVVPNFVADDVAVERADAAEWRARLPTEPYLLYAGALGHYKGVDVLLRAYAGLTQAPPLVLVGMPRPDTPTSLPPNVSVQHSWPADAVMTAWHHSLLGVVPSVFPDPCPTVVMEAMATGRAVVGSRVGGIPDLVADGTTGLLVPPDNADALRQALATLLAAPARRAQMGQAAHERVTAFMASAVVPRIEHAYRSVLPARSASGAPVVETGVRP